MGQIGTTRFGSRIRDALFAVARETACVPQGMLADFFIPGFEPCGF